MNIAANVAIRSAANGCPKKLNNGAAPANAGTTPATDFNMIRTRGIGHGIGFDVCYGAKLDAQGMEYRQILEYFYKDIMLDKRYNACE